MKLPKNDPDLQYTLEVATTAVKYDLNAHRVGRIVAFHPEDLTCDVELLELEESQQGVDKYALIPQLPLLIQGTDTAQLTFGNIVGSECLIHFNDRDIDNWFVTGEAYAPNSKRLHNFSDGFVSLRPFSNIKVFDYDSTGVVLRNTNSKIKITENTVEITNGELQFTISGNTLSIKGNISVDGQISATGKISSDTDVVSAGISGKSHTHTGNLGSPTSAPL